MSQLIVLPAFSIKNREWAREVESSAKRTHPELKTEVLEWKHWRSGNKDDWDVDHEVSRLNQLAVDPEVMIVAKSLGTLVAATYINKFHAQPIKIVLCGIPLADTTKEEQQEYVKFLKQHGNSEAVLIIQNRLDNHGTSEELKDFFVQNSVHFPITVRDRDDHHYPFYDLIINHL